MNWKTIFNPFLKYSEKHLLIATIFGLLSFGYFGYIFNSALVSIFKIAPYPNLTLQNSFIYATLSYSSAILLLFLLGKIFNKQTRFVDITNAVGVSQLPLLLVLIISSLSFFKTNDSELINAMKNSSESGLPIENALILILFLLVIIPFTIFSIVLIYNGFKIATNIKSWQKITVFSVVLFLFLVIYQLSILHLNL